MSHFITKCSECGITMNQCRCMSPDKEVRLSHCGCKPKEEVPKMPLEAILRQCRILDKLGNLVYPGNQLPRIIKRLEKCESALRQVYGDAETCANDDAYNYLEEHGWGEI